QSSDEYMRAVVHVFGLGALGNANCGEACAVRNIRLENLIVHDGSWNGIYVSGGYYQLKTATYGVVDHVVINGVESFNNHKAGIEITCTYFDTPIYAASNIWVLNSYLHDNGGDGAMVGPVRNALLDGNVCSYNGRIRNARVGCWTWDSENTTIQFNESHHNMTPLTNNKARDGSGFDLDLGSRHGLLQYNWSHDNQGEGYLLLAWPVGFGFSRGISENLQMRYNISERDGKKLAGGITVFGGVLSGVIHNNIVYYEPDRLAGTDMFNGEGGALTTSIFGRSGKPDLRIYNNIFLTDGRSKPGAVSNNLWSDATGTFAFNNNVWWRGEGGIRFQWGGSVIATWSGWQGSGFDANGMNSDPRLTGPLGGGPGAYLLVAGSPAIERGRNVTDGWAGMGSRDFFGVTIPQSSAFDIGGSEFRAVSSNPAAWSLSVRRRPDGVWQVRFNGSAGRTYIVQTSTDFRLWTHAGRSSELSPGSFEFLDRTRRGLRFYRALAL
ncbi:MAG TPA: right-handed parallel beta-helix repeat-containing protein, partial [Candidatus Binatia bacterium]|nr:right-handed parallel beta-helix repeat-containing protein [Candidatus Binatia bacterium]